MYKIFHKKNSLSLILFTSIFLLTFFLFSEKNVESASSDAIAMRVFPNPDHISALDWYKKQNFSGSPQSIQVDGYEAVRDGHSVYVNVSNITDTNGDGNPETIYTNIYLITYNQNADNKTEDIFGNILRNWKFNSNIYGSGNCINDNAKSCVYDSDCSIGDYCNSLKARLIRDTKRLSDLAGLNIVLDNYFIKKGSYPNLSSGSYLPGKSLSVWPSWSSTFSSEIGSGVPVDPINKIGPCGVPGYDKNTCWNDVLKKFVETLPDLPTNSLLYGYFSINNGASYNLCSVFETPYSIQPPLAFFIGCSQVCLDFDGDGYGLVGSTLCPETLSDCNDTPVSGTSIHPGAIEICGDGIDQDCNGSDLACASACVDLDMDGYDICDVFHPADTDGQKTDCNDSNANINPGKIDICDGIDNNCSGTIDESCDVDNDNYCSCSQVFEFSSIPLSTCTQTNRTDASTILNTCDCNDSDVGVYPGANESCDGKDNNCVSGIDENCDSDGDGYCDCSANIIIGSPLAGTCLLTINTTPLSLAASCDCNDSLGSVNRGALEICGDGIDQDCNGSDLVCGPVCSDGDNDGYGSPASTACTYPLLDCNNSVYSIHPGATETCGDGIDQDCNGSDLACGPTCVDNDGDLFGNPASAACTYALLDCDNNNINIYPGATEICGDGIDQDCNGSDLPCPPPCIDNDGDGYGNPASASCTFLLTDCNDNNSLVYPGSPEVCGDGIDQDCNGSDLICEPICNDNDGDGYGSPASAVCAYSLLDCDDSRSWIYPGALETCDTFDNNCTSGVDEGCDDDSDGFCDVSKQIYNNNTMCANTFFTANGMYGNDCQDTIASINPGSPEANCSDSVDNDCDGQIDCLDSDCNSSPACNIGCTFPITLPCTF